MDGLRTQGSQEREKARRSGLDVEVDYNGAHLDEFMSVCHETMERRDADEFYYFTEDFFNTIVKCLAGNCVFFHVTLEGKLFPPS